MHGNLICAYTLPEYISDIYVDGLCLISVKLIFEKSSVVTVNSRTMTSLVGLITQRMASNTSVLGSKNVSGVHCVAPGYANYFYKDVNVSFHILQSDKRQLLRR